MNVQSSFPSFKAAQTHGNEQAAGGFPIRDYRFLRDARPARWWLNGDPVATAWFNALSGTFPRGEAFFIESVKAHRDGVPPQLAEQIRSFIVQEINHSREHLALNRIAVEAGYDMAKIDRHVEEMMECWRKCG